MVKRRGINQFKRVKTPQMNSTTRKGCVDRSASLVEKFAKNPRMMEKTVSQDEKDFPLDLPVNAQNDCVYMKVGSLKFQMQTL